MLPAVTLVIVAAHVAAALTEHVLFNPLSTHAVAVLLEVHVMAMLILHSATDVQRIFVSILEWLVGCEGQPMVILRPFPMARHLSSVQATGVKRAVLFHPVLHRMVELDGHH